jgi:hypothetical protein
MLKFELTAGGYRVYDNEGRAWVDVEGDPERPAVDGVLQPFASEAEAEAHATRTIAELTGRPTPATE